MTLEGEKIYLSPFIEADKPKLLYWFNDIELKRQSGPAPYFPIHHEVNINTDPNKVKFAVRSNTTLDLMGFIALSNIQWTNRNAEIGVFIGDPAEQNKGYGREAMSLMLDYGFNELNLHRIELVVVSYNAKAIHLYESIGFKKEGLHREYGERSGKKFDLALFGMLSHEWKKTGDKDLQ